jgi:hypothetical protein
MATYSIIASTSCVITSFLLYIFCFFLLCLVLLSSLLSVLTLIFHLFPLLVISFSESSHFPSSTVIFSHLVAPSLPVPSPDPSVMPTPFSGNQSRMGLSITS